MQGLEGAGVSTHVDEYPSEADMTGEKSARKKRNSSHRREAVQIE